MKENNMKRTWRDAVLEVACNKFMSIPYGETSCFNPVRFMAGLKDCCNKEDTRYNADFLYADCRCQFKTTFIKWLNEYNKNKGE